MRKLAPRHKPNAEMNVVPYIDVMLVLLVIFMVTAPMLAQGVKVQLPKAKSDVVASPADEPLLVLSISQAGTYHWVLSGVPEAASLEHSGSLEELEAFAAPLAVRFETMRVQVRGDAQSHYGQVVLAIAQLQRLGLTRLSLLTEPQA